MCRTATVQNHGHPVPDLDASGICEDLRGHLTPGADGAGASNADLGMPGTSDSGVPC